MKLNLKMIALAVAMVATGSANAALIGSGSNGGSSLALVAFNSVTNAYYVRDLGLQLDAFLPSTITTLPGDGIGGVAVTGNKTPEAGLTIDKTTNASFADGAFSTWLAGQTAADVRWTVTAGDSLTTGANGVGRILVAATGPLALVSNGAVRAGAAQVEGIPTFSGLSDSGATVNPLFTVNLINQQSTLSSLDVAANLYYFSATTQTGSTAVAANKTEFGNSAGFATLTLASNGDLSYMLAPALATPIPAAAWLLGSGLMGLGGIIRRRKAAAQA